MPCSAPLPVPTIIATGVANPKAQGHAITNTEIAKLNASSNGYLNSKNVINVITAIDIIIGTNIPEILSTSLEIGAFELLASSTSLIIVAIEVSSPTCVALI